MYSIILTNGKSVNINADTVEYLDKERIMWFINKNHIVARINMDNVVGWINTDYKEETEG